MAKTDTVETQVVETQVSASNGTFQTDMEQLYAPQIAEANNDPLISSNLYLGFCSKDGSPVAVLSRFDSLGIVNDMRKQVNELGYDRPYIMMWDTKSSRFLYSEKYQQQAFPKSTERKVPELTRLSQVTTDLENMFHASANKKIFGAKITSRLVEEVVYWYLNMPETNEETLYNAIANGLDRARERGVSR